MDSPESKRKRRELRVLRLQMYVEIGRLVLLGCLLAWIVGVTVFLVCLITRAS